MNKPIILRTADIYLRFPEIMEEEAEDLAEFLEYEHIVYEGATDIFIDKDKEIARLNKIIDELEQWLKDTYNHFMYDNCEEILHNKQEEMEKYGFMYNLSSIYDKANIIEIIRKKLKELKEEDK